ncbi:MAG: segregation and condensation protein B [Candidatus Hepatoplasma vulgare]|nr:MAG: segregation and condensation protein B [Candidatus Hepatoplasma sp.]
METKILMSILFLKGKNGITKKEISKIMNVSLPNLKKIIKELETDLIKKDLPFILKDFDDYIWLSISSDISVEISKIMKKDVAIKLTTSLVETLTIIAYKQPITKSEIQAIRGSSADYALMKLLNHDLIQYQKETDSINSPKKFYTSHYFLKLFNLKSLLDLPQLEKDFQEKTEEIQLFDYDERK